MYRLYYSPGACSLAARIVLEETGAPYEAELVSAVDSRMTETPAYRRSIRRRGCPPCGRCPARSAPVMRS